MLTSPGPLLQQHAGPSLCWALMLHTPQCPQASAGRRKSSCGQDLVHPPKCTGERSMEYTTQSDLGVIQNMCIITQTCSTY